MQMHIQIDNSGILQNKSANHFMKISNLMAFFFIVYFARNLKPVINIYRGSCLIDSFYLLFHVYTAYSINEKNQIMPDIYSHLFTFRTVRRF